MAKKKERDGRTKKRCRRDAGDGQATPAAVVAAVCDLAGDLLDAHAGDGEADDVDPGSSVLCLAEAAPVAAALMRVTGARLDKAALDSQGMPRVVASLSTAFGNEEDVMSVTLPPTMTVSPGEVLLVSLSRVEPVAG